MLTRTNCIWCRSTNLLEYFKNDYSSPIASYMEDTCVDFESVPYNIQKCNNCNAYQIKYLADPSNIYKKNHAYSYGSTLTDMCNEFSRFCRESSFSKVIEIGAGNGFLADNIISSNPLLDYTIIDPCYFGNTENRRIIPTFIEDYDTHDSSNDTVIFSHVFEHFFEPLKIIEKLNAMPNLHNVFLNMPNLELYLQNKTFHVLNTEHTYFVENQFLIDFFALHGFILNKKTLFKEHSVFFHFVKSETPIQCTLKNSNADILIHNFFSHIEQITTLINTLVQDGPIYMWPCSMHSQFLLNFGIKQENIKALLDNSKEKIGHYLYGFPKLCGSLYDILILNEPSTILLNGGCFNHEIKSMINSVNCDKVKLIFI